MNFFSDTCVQINELVYKCYTCYFDWLILFVLFLFFYVAVKRFVFAFICFTTKSHTYFPMNSI